MHGLFPRCRRACDAPTCQGCCNKPGPKCQKTGGDAAASSGQASASSGSDDRNLPESDLTVETGVESPDSLVPPADIDDQVFSSQSEIDAADLEPPVLPELSEERADDLPLNDIPESPKPDFGPSDLNESNQSPLPKNDLGIAERVHATPITASKSQTVVRRPNLERRQINGNKRGLQRLVEHLNHVANQK
jgi:hypothetical protein